MVTTFLRRTLVLLLIAGMVFGMGSMVPMKAAASTETGRVMLGHSAHIAGAGMIVTEQNVSSAKANALLKDGLSQGSPTVTCCPCFPRAMQKIVLGDTAARHDYLQLPAVGLEGVRPDTLLRPPQT